MKESLTKINTTTDAFNFLLKCTKIKKHRSIDYFFTMYLNGTNQVQDFKIIQKKKTELISDIISQILTFDQTENISCLIVFHQPAKWVEFEFEKDIANQIADKAFFSLVNILDFICLYSPKYYESMHDKNIQIADKYRHELNNTIRKNEKIEYSTQELFEMQITTIKNLIHLEFCKISLIDSFVCWETIDSDLERERYMDMRFKSVFPSNSKEQLSKIYLITVLNDYMKAKNRLLSFVIKSNRYEKYLFYQFNHDEYHRLRKQKEAAKNTKVMRVQWHNHINIIQFQTTTLLCLQA